jgi:membrane-associated protease RseP (regulator of RpoE activity)
MFSMKAKHALSLLVVLILGTGMALAQQKQKSPPPPSPPDEEAIENSFDFVFDGNGFLGVYAEDISKENMSRYNLNQVRGVGITSIVKDSPAEKAGLRKDDVILRIDGENVTSVRRLNRLVSEIAPDQTVKLAISRGGSEQEMVATMGRRNSSDAWRGLLGDGQFKGKFGNFGKLGNLGNFGNWEWDRNLENGEGPLVFAFGSSRRIGVSTTPLTKQLAEFFGVPGGKGVLVTSVAEDGPAAKGGMKAGDVITAIDGEPIAAIGDIARVMSQKKEGDVTLTIIRNKSQQSIRITPQSGGLPAGTIDRPQIGRRIVIPRIDIRTMPEVNIDMPQIEIQTIPSVNIRLPRINVTPRIRVLRGTNGPI